MFEGADFGGMGNDQLKFLTDFLSEKNVDLKTEYHQKAIKVMTQFDSYVIQMKNYYNDDFVLFIWWNEVVDKFSRRMISKDRKVREEVKEIARGLFEDTTTKDFVNMFEKR